MKSDLEALLGIETPLVQAPIGSASCPELAAAVSNAGGLGMLALSWRSLDDVRSAITRTQRLTKRVFGVNVVLEWPQLDRVRISLDHGVRIVSTFWGDDSELVGVVHEREATLIHSVGSVEEALRAVDMGVDIIVAQGAEAGGHVRGNVPLNRLLPAVCDAVGKVPVLAAGGIATPEQAAGLITMGAAGVWIGTRFICSLEANVHPAYQSAIISAGTEDTYHGEVFTKGWENAPHRVLRNSTVEAWIAAGLPAPGKRPGETEVVAWGPDGSPIERYSDIIPLPDTQGEVESLALYAGTGAGLITSVTPASTIVAEFRESLGG